MKVGMITIYRKNYGAFLQAYALQRSLIKAGAEPEIIQYDYYRDRTILGLPIDTHPTLKTILKKALVEIVRFVPHKKRQLIFNRSIKENIIESKEYFKSYGDLTTNPPIYDVYITGSDQVFNPCINSVQALPARLLCFVKSGIKCSYAASAGTDHIPDNYNLFFREALGAFKSISVREEGLKNYITSVYGIRAVRHIDPVFLLNKEEWARFAKPIEGLPKGYIFYYRVLPQEDLGMFAEKISSEMKLPVFVADGHDHFVNQVNRRGFLSPEQWVYAINNAAYVITNSFHGASFSINLEKRTTILVPPKGGERVTDLLSRCKMDFMIENPLYMLRDSSFELSSAKKYIKEERERGLKYLIDICSNSMNER